MTPHALLERLHAAQGAFYAGGPPEPLRALLADDIVWTVPGDNAIAGRYEGADAVMACSPAAATSPGAASACTRATC